MPHPAPAHDRGLQQHGPASRRFALGVEEINAAGGVKGRKIELVVYDDRHDSKEAVAIANKLIERDRVVGVVSGSYSMPSRVTAPVFAKAGMPMTVGYAVHPDVTKAGPCIFVIKDGKIKSFVTIDTPEVITPPVQ